MASGVVAAAIISAVASADGQRFLFDALVEEVASPVALLLNWMPPNGSVE